MDQHLTEPKSDKASQLRDLVGDMEMQVTIQCTACTERDTVAAISFQDAALWFYNKGWRYTTSAKYGQEGITCLKCREEDKTSRCAVGRAGKRGTHE